jgi:hypothetical protein
MGEIFLVVHTGAETNPDSYTMRIGHFLRLKRLECGAGFANGLKPNSNLFSVIFMD